MTSLDLPFVHSVLASFNLPDNQRITLVSRKGSVSSSYAVYYTDGNGGCFNGSYVVTHDEATREFVRRIDVNIESLRREGEG
jgi:hypothetical protein